MENKYKIGVGTNKKIIDLYGMMENEPSLILQPSFQRRLVWNDAHKEKFLETILCGYPFPEVYFADGEIDLEKKKSITLVVDGQQRLHTIYQYITDDENLILKRIKRFLDLTVDEQTSFLDYLVVVRDLGRISKEEIKEIFSRINSVQYALNAMEINNALYEGEFIATAKTVSETNLLSELLSLNDTEISRMKDLEFIALIMSTIEVGGYFTSDKEIENVIKKYDNKYPNAEKMQEAFIAVLQYIKELKLEADSIWYRKTCIFTLITELLFKKIIGTDLPEKYNFEKNLKCIEQSVLEAKITGKPSEYYDFYNYIFQGTASRKGRLVRGQLLRKFL